MINTIQKVMAKRAAGEKGFTLVELLVVVVILVVLAAIAIPLFLNQRDKAAHSVLLTNGKTVNDTLIRAVSEQSANISGIYWDSSAGVFQGGGLPDVGEEGVANPSMGFGKVLAFGTTADDWRLVLGEPSTGQYVAFNKSGEVVEPETQPAYAPLIEQATTAPKALYLNGTVGTNVTLPASVLNYTGMTSLDARVIGAPDDIPITTPTQVMMGQNTNLNTNSSWVISLWQMNNFMFFYGKGYTGVHGASVGNYVGRGASSGKSWGMRLTWEPNGDLGSYTSLDGGANWTGGTWKYAVLENALSDGGTPITLGSYGDGSSPFKGQISSAMVKRNGVIVASFDAHRAYTQTQNSGTNLYTDPQGNTWTLNNPTWVDAS